MRGQLLSGQTQGQQQEEQDTAGDKHPVELAVFLFCGMRGVHSFRGQRWFKKTLFTRNALP
ncbi:MAG: hypothetical protein D3919_14105 [Candidatus Electrothrix sp. AW5]|nr:hypothetical protein [Candidatus Electrothrix gigas]